MDTCRDHEISYWPDMGCPMCAAQSRIAELEADVERLTGLLGKQDKARERNGWNDAIEAASSLQINGMDVISPAATAYIRSLRR